MAGGETLRFNGLLGLGQWRCFELEGTVAVAPPDNCLCGSNVFHTLSR